MSSVKELWGKIEEYLKLSSPEMLASLNKGATEEELEQVETTLGVKLPEDYRECLKVHNGEEGDIGLLNGWLFLSTEDIIREWNIWNDLLLDGTFEGFESEPEAGIKPSWWNAKWVPIMHNGGGDFCCIDLDADVEAGGTVGQVIEMWHDSEERSLKGKCFCEYFKMFSEKLGKEGFQRDDE